MITPLADALAKQGYTDLTPVQIAVTDVRQLHAACAAAGAEIFGSLEPRTYQRRDDKVSQTQFVVQDPDGYLIRLAEIRGLKD